MTGYERVFAYERVFEAVSVQSVARAARVGVVGFATAVLVGCGSDDESAQDRYCAAGDSLRSSITALTDLDLVATGTDGLNDAVDDIRSDLDDLGESASEAAADDVSALQEEVDDLGAALADLGGELTSANVSAVASAVGDVGTAARAVFDTLADC